MVKQYRKSFKVSQVVDLITRSSNMPQTVTTGIARYVTTASATVVAPGDELPKAALAGAVCELLNSHNFFSKEMKKIDFNVSCLGSLLF
jgi:hypothetical protein